MGDVIVEDVVLLTLTETARLLNVHRTTVQRWCVHGTIRAIKLPGDMWRIPSTEIQRLTIPEGDTRSVFSFQPTSLPVE